MIVIYWILSIICFIGGVISILSDKENSTIRGIILVIISVITIALLSYYAGYKIGSGLSLLFCYIQALKYLSLNENFKFII